MLLWQNIAENIKTKAPLSRCLQITKKRVSNLLANLVTMYDLFLYKKNEEIKIFI